MTEYSSGDILCPTFIVSEAITQKTLEKLNQACPADSDWSPKFTNVFNPVPNDLTKMLQPSKVANKFTIDVIEDDLAKTLDSRKKKVETHMREDGYTISSASAVLDARSAQDNTVVLYYSNAIFDEATDKFDHEELLDWRVKFCDAKIMVNSIDHLEFVVIDPSLIEGREEFTDSNGIFDFRAAMEED